MLGVLFFLFSLAFIWRNFYDILVFVNGVYLNVKDWYLKNDFNYNSFKEISREYIITTPDKKIIAYDYKFKVHVLLLSKYIDLNYVFKDTLSR